MKFDAFRYVAVDRCGIALRVTLRDPQTRNAMSPGMVEELQEVAAALPDDCSRCVIFRGADGTFCSGGDIRRFAIDAVTIAPTDGPDAIEQSNRAFGSLLERLDAAPQLIVSAVEGAAFGGGCGLVCASDMVIAMADARFALSETTLGVVPAQISPFVVRRLGVPRARRLTMTGARFDGRAAQDHGLVDQLSDDIEAFERAIVDVIAAVARCAPRANAAAKALFARASQDPVALTLDDAARLFAVTLRDEGREGATAFVEKRSAEWATNDR